MSQLGAENYFDNAATTPLEPVALEAMMPYLTTCFGNDHSIHSWGRAAHQAVDNARETIANMMDVDPDHVYFTSGATEANNWVLACFKSATCSAMEHPSIAQPLIERHARFIPNEGFELAAEHADLTCVMHVNNETGAILRPSVTEGTHLHRDATQGFGKYDLRQEPGDTFAISGHKINGPKGVGALLAKCSCIKPWFVGGGHEFGMRSGTTNVPGIVGFATSARIWEQERESRYSHATKLRSIFIEELAGVPDFNLNEYCRQSPYILSLSFKDVLGEAVVIDLDSRGYAISAGSACSSGKTEISRVLKALGLPPEYAVGTIRVSFSHFNTEESTVKLAGVIKEAVESLRMLGPVNL